VTHPKLWDYGMNRRGMRAVLHEIGVEIDPHAPVSEVDQLKLF